MGPSTFAICRRSSATKSDTTGVRNPINYATSYLDLDFVYGRTEHESKALRSEDGGGLMNITDTGVPFMSDNGTWLVSSGLELAGERWRWGGGGGWW